MWRKFKRNRLAFGGLLLIFLFFLIALLGPIIRPDSTPKANDQHLELARKSPGFECQFIQLPNATVAESSFLEKWLFGAPNPYRESPIQDYRIVEGGVIVIPFSAPSKAKEFEVFYNAEELENYEEAIMKERPSFIVDHRYLLGTDRYGRDLLSRLMAGCWISFSVGIISLSISLFIGIALGAIAGYFGGKIDDLIVWFFNVVWSIPTLLLVIAITLVLGKGFWQVFVAVGLTMWVEVARLVRGQVMEMRSKEFVEAGRAFGYKSRRIILKHILPNISGPIIVISASNFAAAILIEAGLSFLGLGAQPPQATWGKMISEHKGYIITGDAYLAIFPGIAIFLLVLAFVVVGNGLRDAFDSKQLSPSLS
ncbi:MAG: peptide transporter [Flavobacteriales bacterium]|nr:peptide transporter [Flavobacteriales bacterium]